MRKRNEAVPAAPAGAAPSLPVTAPSQLANGGVVDWQQLGNQIAVLCQQQEAWRDLVQGLLRLTGGPYDGQVYVRVQQGLLGHIRVAQEIVTERSYMTDAQVSGGEAPGGAETVAG